MNYSSLSQRNSEAVIKLATRGQQVSKVLFQHHSFRHNSLWLYEVKLTSFVDPLSELWPTAPPEPACSSSAHVSHCLPVKWSPSDKPRCRFVLGAVSPGLRLAVRSCGRHHQQGLASTSWLAPQIHTWHHRREPAGYHYLEFPLCLSCRISLPEMSSDQRGYGWPGGRPAACLSLASPFLCKKQTELQRYYK